MGLRCTQTQGARSRSMGLNGVATLVRCGLTSGAERDALREPALDQEGRCLLTLHGRFALFNVYVRVIWAAWRRLAFSAGVVRCGVVCAWAIRCPTRGREPAACPSR